MGPRRINFVKAGSARGEYLTQSAVFSIPITDDGEVLIGGDERERTDIAKAKSGCSELRGVGGSARGEAGGRGAPGRKAEGEAAPSKAGRG